MTGPREVPVLPVRHAVLFPFALLPLGVGRPKSVQMLNDAMGGDRTIAVFTQRDPAVDDPGPSDLYPVGTLGTVLRMVRMPDGQISILAQGLSRVKLDDVVTREPYLKARVTPLDEVLLDDVETEALAKNLVEQFTRVVELTPALPDEAGATARNQSSPARTADFIASILDLPADEKQRLLEMLVVKERLQTLNELLARLLQVLEVGQQIQASVQESLDQRQKEFLLRQQMAAIQKELGEGDDAEREIQELREKIEKAQMPPEVRKEADRELARLARIPVQAAEYTVARTYLEWLCDMPWAVTTEDNLELQHVRAVLDTDHFGLDKIKERILEYLAVRRFKKDARTPIVCFAGPPGTGKTSLGQSIAKALGRKFVRQSLGGVRDEAEIRGHRRTYIGALPGNVIRGIRRAGSRNPLFMLDEIDKLGADFRGDPASALLEVLDPQQNSGFVDHYLDVPFDLSQVMFVTTANYLDPVPPALRDRMEVIELSGYTEAEKVEIAKRHLIPKAIAENGLEELHLTFSDEAILKVIRDYTSEAGLRNLERELANLLRRTAKQIAEGKDPPRAVTPERVRELLGPEQFTSEKATRIDQPGAALGLAWTPAGGEVLVVEASIMPGSKQLQLTGQLGDVMKESALAALSYIRAHADTLGLDLGFFENVDLHVHLPSGAIPKDGPSAGITLATAIASIVTARKVRSGIAMTGELTLLGRVLPIGGLKEKVLAAHRAGIKTVIIPAENQKDLEEVPIEVRTHMIFAPVERIDQVLTLALEPAEPEEAAEPEAATPEAVQVEASRTPESQSTEEPQSTEAVREQPSVAGRASWHAAARVRA
ncbi:MAG TPA: endopeptidase La [Candidatus Limnocylindria bacterium]|nr:endopeptidase La [Candidatus Limnocylindria bacterium]